MKQSSAWGQFWFTLSENHQIYHCGIVTPLQGGNRQPGRKAYYAVWIKQTGGGPIYKTIEGDTMHEMMRNGLDEFGVWNLRIKLALLAVLMDDLAYAVSGTR